MRLIRFSRDYLKLILTKIFMKYLKIFDTLKIDETGK